MRAAREGHRDRDVLAFGLALGEHLLQRRGVEPDPNILVGLRHRDRLAVEVEPRHDRHRQRHVVLRHLAGRDQVRHRGQDMRPVNAVGRAAEHQVVARRAPARLLQHLDIGHAMLGEEALLLGDDQRRSVGQGDEAELGARDFGPGPLRKCARGEQRLGRHQRRGGSRRAGEESPAAEEEVVVGLVIRSLRVMRSTGAPQCPSCGPKKSCQQVMRAGLSALGTPVGSFALSGDAHHWTSDDREFACRKTQCTRRAETHRAMNRHTDQ